MEERVKGHVLVLPFPGQSHINPMLQFSKLLISKGLKATLITTLSISKSLHLPSSIGSLNLDVISDGHDNDTSALADLSGSYYSSLKTFGSKTLIQLIAKYQNSSCPIDCLVYEPFMPWALDVAKQLGLRAAAFFTMPCAVEYIYYNVHNGLLRLPISSTPVSIQGLPLLELRDMPMVIGVPGSYPVNLKMYLDQFSNLDKADFVFINTFYKLEDEVIDMMSMKYPVLTIGPTIPSIYLQSPLKTDHQNQENYGLDILSPHEHASNSSKWLSTKPPGSVVYVSFGSIVELTEQQTQELAWGLKRSNFNFLWATRPSEEPKIPRNFKEGTKDQGLVINWSTQMKILSHEAVGCFVTHSGWNSTVEALSLGVPMVAMPQWSDQPTNAMLVESVWKVGIRAMAEENGLVMREEIERCIKEVMDGESGREMKVNARKWRDLAVEAVSEGGTSHENINDFVFKLSVK